MVDSINRYNKNEIDGRAVGSYLFFPPNLLHGVIYHQLLLCL